MPETIEFYFSESFDGTVWKTLADPDKNRLFLEVRNSNKKNVSFSVVDMGLKKIVLKDITFDEKWWISMTAVSGDILLFTIYTDTNNPDQKSVMAYDIQSKKVLWWKNNFVIAFITNNEICGVETKFGSREILIDVYSGIERKKDTALLHEPQNLMIIRPFQYHEGTEHFKTVSSFLASKCSFSPVLSVEYCEHHSLILISAFTGQEDLANYLFVFKSNGEILLKEILGEHLKGIASDTFFIFSGFLIFVKNKCEVVSYKFL